MKRLSAPKRTQYGRMQLRAVAAATRGRVRGRPTPPGGGGGGGGGTGLRAAINLPGVDPFIGVFPYADLMKSTNSLWTSTDFPNGMPRTDSRLNSNHYPTAVPAGTTVTMLVWLGMENLRQTVKVKSGTYKITWTPVNGASITVGAGTGISSIVSGTAGVATFTLTADCPALFLSVTGIGSTGGGDNIRVFHTSHETALNAGDPLHPDFVTQIQSWTYLRSVRFLDFLNTNVSSVVNAADWTALAYQSYCRSDRGCPPEILGMIGAKLPATVGLWTTMPRTATDAAKASMYAKIKAQEPSGTRMIYCEGINEAWNSGFPAYTPLGTVDYVGLDVRDINGTASTAFNDRLTAAYMQHAFRCWLAAEAEFGTNRVTRIVGVQTDFYAFMAPWIHYRDTTGLNSYSGATALTLMNDTAGGKTAGEMCFTWYFYAYNGSSIKQRVREDMGGLSDAAVKAIWLADIDTQRTANLVPQCTNYRARGFTGNFGTYEGACHDFWDRNDTGSAIASGTTNTGTNVVTFADTNWVFDGNQVSSQAAVIATGNPVSTFFYVRKATSTTLRFYATVGAYNADSGNTGAGAVTLLAGTFQFVNQTFANRAASFVSVANTGTNTLNCPVDTTDWITDGDQLVAPNQTAVSGLSFPFWFYVRKTGTNSLRCYATLGAYTADSGNTGAGAATVVAGITLLANATRFARMSDKVSSIFKGTVGQEIYQYVVDNNLKHATVQAKSINLFVAISSDRNNDQRFVHSFDAHNLGQFGGDTPAVTYLKGLSGL